MTPAAAWGEPKPCLKGEVAYVGGAIACPTCKTAADDYQYDPAHGDEVNGHIRKALNDDLESAKWLMAYFSSPKHKDYAEAKKWFGRALSIGANAADLRLSDGYDEPYLSTAIVDTVPAIIYVVSSCLNVDNAWRPRCFSQKIIAHAKDTNGETAKNNEEGETLDTSNYCYTIKSLGETIFYLGNKNFKKNSIAIDSLFYYQGTTEYYFVFESSGHDSTYIRRDYFKNGLYIGSDQAESVMHKVRPPHKLLNPKELADLKQKIAASTFRCQTFDLRPYPAKGYDGKTNISR